MNIIKFLIPTLLIGVDILLIRYDTNKELKNKHIAWISNHIYGKDNNMNASASRLLQTILGFLFILCIGITSLFIIGLIER